MNRKGIRSVDVNLKQIRAKPSEKHFDSVKKYMDNSFAKTVRVEALKTLLKLPSLDVVPFCFEFLKKEENTGEYSEKDKSFRLDILEQLSTVKTPLHIQEIAIRFSKLPVKDRRFIAGHLFSNNVPEDHPVMQQVLTDKDEFVRKRVSREFWDALSEK